jgi:hypothetical protein
MKKKRFFLWFDEKKRFFLRFIGFLGGVELSLIEVLNFFFHWEISPHEEHPSAAYVCPVQQTLPDQLRTTSTIWA